MIKKDPEKVIMDLHHSLGQWIRNNWKLWVEDSVLTKYFNNLGIFHADDMSGIIITSFGRWLNKEDLRLEEQIKYYQDYWERYKTGGIKTKMEFFE